MGRGCGGRDHTINFLFPPFFLIVLLLLQSGKYSVLREMKTCHTVDTNVHIIDFLLRVKYNQVV